MSDKNKTCIIDGKECSLSDMGAGGASADARVSPCSSPLEDMRDRIVIIGAGIAGVNAATSLAQGHSVVLINREPYLPYYRMRLEEIVSGKSEDDIIMHPASWYKEKGIELLEGEVVGIERDNKSVLLKDGRRLGYDKLLIATGSDAISLPFAPGLTLRTVDDAKKLRSILLSSRGVVSIIGGGLLGLELASSIREAFSLPVQVFESADHILPLQLDAESSDILKASFLERGINIETSVRLSSYEDGRLIDCEGRSYEAGTIIFSVGSSPSKSLGEVSGLACAKGIIVNEDLVTSDDDIYALGDCAERDGRCSSLAMYAREMGLYAAKSINGEGLPYRPSQSSTILKVGGIDVASFGAIDGEARRHEKGLARITAFVKDGVVAGVVLINAKAFMMKAKNAIGKEYTEALFE